MGWKLWVVVGLLVFAGCGPNVSIVEDTDSGSGDEGSGDAGETESDSDTSSLPDPSELIPIHEARGVDIILVIDDSGSMGEEQQTIAANIGVLVDALEARDVDYRIAMTTTDNGNYWCLGTGISNPEAGSFVFSSCLERIDDFMFAPGDVDARFACTDACPEEWATIASTPTATSSDPEPKSRPWLERVGGVTNLPLGLDPVTALQCLVPQGVNGCGFESHLESMYKSLRRSFEESEDEFGFIDDDSVLAVLILTDEADCSYNTEWEAIFYPASEGGNQVFWSLPDLQSPTSAVCWNAGVACVPDGGPVYDECVAQDKAIDGTAATNEDEAVIFPISRYVDLLQGIENAKQDINPGQEVVVAAIAGVPEQYPAEPIVYAQGADPDDPASFQALFGIAEGCTSPNGRAVPPVRIRDFLERFALGGEPSLWSVCRSSYADGLNAFADQIDAQLRSSCMPACVANTDPTSVVPVPSCVVTQTWSDDFGQLLEIVVPQCNDSVLPPDSDVCWVPRVDKVGVTGATVDDMSQDCADEGWNLEFGFVRRDGVPSPAGAALGAECDLSQNKAVDCPDLP